MNRNEFIKKANEKLLNAGDNEFVALWWLTRNNSVIPPTKDQLAELGIYVDE